MGFGGGARTPFYKTLPNRNLIATEEKAYIFDHGGPLGSSNMSQINRNTQSIFAYIPYVILRISGFQPKNIRHTRKSKKLPKEPLLAYVYANGAYWPSPRGPSWAPKVATRNGQDATVFSKIILPPRERKRFQTPRANHRQRNC